MRSPSIRREAAIARQDEAQRVARLLHRRFASGDLGAPVPSRTRVSVPRTSGPKRFLCQSPTSA